MAVKELQDYLKEVGTLGAQKLAISIGTHHNYLYQIASGFRKASPKFAIALHKATYGKVNYSKTLGNQAQEVWPPDMFFYHEEWKSKDVN